jgi:hypothetical protein
MNAYRELEEYVENWLGGQVRVLPAPRPSDGCYALEVRIGEANDGFVLVGLAPAFDQIDDVARRLMPAVMSLAAVAR